MASNNALWNHDCPALMSDGRIATDYRQSCTINNLIQSQNGIMNAYDYKLYMQRNGEAIQRLEREFFQNKNSCTSCGGYYQADPSNLNDYWAQYKAWVFNEDHIGNSGGATGGGGCPLNEAFTCRKSD